jgi:hypothetical protein
VVAYQRPITGRMYRIDLFDESGADIGGCDEMLCVYLVEIDLSVRLTLYFAPGVT